MGKQSKKTNKQTATTTLTKHKLNKTAMDVMRHGVPDGTGFREGARELARDVSTS